VGSVTTGSGVTQNVTGVSAVGAVGNTFVWSKIVPIQSPEWTPVSPSSTPNWKKIAS